MFLYEHLEHIKTLLEDKPENIEYRAMSLCPLIVNQLPFKENLAFAKELARIFKDGKKHAFRSWEFYSGNDIYPVPRFRQKKLNWFRRVFSFIEHPRRAQEAEDAYWESNYFYVGDYGKMRLELLDHLIQYFKVRML